MGEVFGLTPWEARALSYDEWCDRADWIDDMRPRREDGPDAETH